MPSHHCLCRSERGLRGRCTLVVRTLCSISLLARSRSASEQNLLTSDSDILPRCLRDADALRSVVRMLETERGEGTEGDELSSGQ